MKKKAELKNKNDDSEYDDEDLDDVDEESYYDETPEPHEGKSHLQ